MNLGSNNGDAHITVIPYYSYYAGNYRREIIVDLLYFWHNNTFEHQVNDESITKFLLHVAMFGAIIFPDCPELGCLAINGQQSFANGEVAVNEIHYKGQVIYCRS